LADLHHPAVQLATPGIRGDFPENAVTHPNRLNRPVPAIRARYRQNLRTRCPRTSAADVRRLMVWQDSAVAALGSHQKATLISIATRFCPEYNITNDFLNDDRRRSRPAPSLQ
jgi:hypothetical protein